MRHAGQPHLSGQHAGHRPRPGGAAPLRGHERPAAARGGGRSGRREKRRAPAGRLRYHRGHGDDGHFLPGRFHRRPQGAAGPHDRGLHRPRRAGDRGPAPRGGGHGRAAEGRAQAQSGADAGGDPRHRPRRAVRQHRPRLQQRHRHPHGPEARRLRRDGGGLRRRSGRGKVFGHQVPHGGTDSGGLRGGGHRPGAEDARGPGQKSAGRRGPGRAGAGPAQSATPCFQHEKCLRPAHGGGREPVHHRYRRGAFPGGGALCRAGGEGCAVRRVGQRRRGRQGAGGGGGTPVRNPVGLPLRLRAGGRHRPGAGDRGAPGLRRRGHPPVGGGQGADRAAGGAGLR